MLCYMTRASAGAWARAAVLLTLSLAAGSAGGQQCRDVSVTVSMGSRHNASGHTETSVRLQRSSPVPKRGPTDVQLEVTPATSICGDTRFDAVTLVVRGPPPPPGPGYTVVPGVGYYRIHLQNVTWSEAKAACEAESARLLVINSADEDKAIQHLLKQQRNLPTWLFIGFHDMTTEGQYFTIFGDPVSSLGYERWEPGQPDDYNGVEDCGTVWSRPPTGGLNDFNCMAKTGFICEQNVA